MCLRRLHHCLNLHLSWNDLHLDCFLLFGLFCTASCSLRHSNTFYNLSSTCKSLLGLFSLSSFVSVFTGLAKVWSKVIWRYDVLALSVVSFVTSFLSEMPRIANVLDRPASELQLLHAPFLSNYFGCLPPSF